MPWIKKIIIVLYTLPLLTFAEPLSYSLLEPIGGLSGAQTYSGYVVGILQIFIGLAGLLAVVRIVICGMELLASASPSKISETKACIWSAIMGVLLALSGWLILYTINPNLTNLDIRQVTVNQARPSAAGFYYTYTAANGSTAYGGPSADAGACAAARAGNPSATSDPCFEITAPVIAAGSGGDGDWCPVGSPRYHTYPPPAEAAARNQMNSLGGFSVNRPKGCIDTCDKSGCTNVAGLESSFAFIKSLPGTKVITGGTEEHLHVSHRAGLQIFDMRMNGISPTLNTYITSFPSTPSFSGYLKYRVPYAGGDYFFTNEGGDHWHVCRAGAMPGPACN